MIKPIDEMDLPKNKSNFREMIRADIKEALDSEIYSFEFEGDYNYKYLAQYVREEARRVFNEMSHRECVSIKKNLGYDFHMTYGTFGERFYKVMNHKGSDRNHVYMVIDLSNFHTECENYVKSEYEKHLRFEERRKERH